MKVQLIRKRLYHDLEDLISSFDLTACSAGFDGVKVYSHRRFVTDVSNKIIAFNTIEYPVATLGRILKYKDKGYTIKGWAKEEYVRTVNESQYDPENMALYID